MISAAENEWQSLAPDGTKVQYFDQCGSTNSLATEAGAKGLPGNTWFVAGKQSAGKGRRGNAWLSETGNLYSSYLARPAVLISELATLPYLVSLAVRDTFIALGCKSESVQCKWPNDVLINEKKASGILIESNAGSGMKCDFIVIGIGLNLKNFPPDARFPATSVLDETSSLVKVTAAFRVLSRALQQRIDSWRPNDVGSMIEEWRACGWGIGMRREIRTNNESFFATLEGVDDTGGLSLRLDDGTMRCLYAGEVFGPPINH